MNDNDISFEIGTGGCIIALGIWSGIVFGIGYLVGAA